MSGRRRSGDDGLPPWTEQMRGLAVAAAQAVQAAAQGEAVLADDDEVVRRLSICMTCERYEAASRRCLECGCLLRIKTRLASASCPLGSW